MKIAINQNEKKKIFSIFKSIMNHPWVTVISIMACITVTVFAIHTFALRNYGSSMVLGLATGLSLIAAFWLTYSLAKPK